eukprot:gene28549-37507_t
MSQLIYMARKLAHNKVCAIVESSQLSYMPSNSLEDFDDSCFTFYYGDTNHMSVKPNSSMGDGTNGSGARYLLFSKDIKCALQVEEGPTPLIERSPYYQNGILNQLFSYLSSQEDCKVKRSTIASTSDISSHHSFHQYHRDLSFIAHDKASVNHRQHHATKHRHFSPTENGSLVQITDLSSLSDKLPLKETLALSVHPTEFIFIVTVTNDEIILFSHWLRWARVAGFSKFIVFAMDAESKASAIANNLQTFSPASLHQMTYNEKIVYRHEFFMSLLRNGMKIFSIGVNTFVLDNPASFPGANGQYKLSSELFGISPDEKGDAFMRKVSQCVNGTIMLGSAFQKVALTERRVAATLKYHACMEKSLLDIQRGSKSSVFFDLKIPQSNGYIPKMLHIDSPLDQRGKINRLEKWNLALEGDGEHPNPTVKTAPYINHSSIPDTAPAKHMVLTIRIITMDRPEPLQRLLASLVGAKYDSDPVNMEFYVDHPKDVSSSSNQGKTALYMAVVGIVNNFQWKQGSVTRHFEEQNAGIFKMWVRKFPVDEPDTSDRKHIMMYEHHSMGNLYGFTLQRQHSVLGIKKGGKYQLTYVDKDVAQASPFYRYQLLSTWGQFFYPGHWNAFVEWALVARQAKDFNPCIPYMFCNRWYLDRPENIWSIWFNYYVYQTGLTNLYINYNHYHPDLDYGLLINYRENGLHFSKKKISREFSNVILIRNVMNLTMPALVSFPVYNFFFRVVENENILKYQWRFTSNYGNRSCVTNV